MSEHSSRRCSVFCFLPPYVLRSIAQNGSREQRVRATRTMASDGTFRSLRAELRLPPGLERRPAVLTKEGRKRREVYDCGNTRDLPGELARLEGEDATGDAAVDEAYDGLGATYDLFWEAYERDSIDDAGLTLSGHVHFGREYENAFWDGRRMVFGDGDGDLFSRFTVAVDIVGHELTHGVTEDEARLAYLGQSGALNESVSDVFGSLVKQRVRDQTAEGADWLIGEGLFTEEVQGVALRSMKEPGTAFDDPVLGEDPQPAHMDEYVETFEDNGGVHINSGIPNRAFYLAATALGSYAWEKAGRIWYETLRDPGLRPNANFRDFSRLTVINAGRLYGGGDPEEQAVRDAWAGVGLKVS